MKKVKYYDLNRPFLELVGSVLRIRQATELGYAECDPGGMFDYAYPSSKLRRSRVKDRGSVCHAICTVNTLAIWIGYEEV